LPGGRVLSLMADKRGEQAAVERTEQMARDALFVHLALFRPGRRIGRYAHRLDGARVLIAGHSLGGAAALEAGRVRRELRPWSAPDGAPWGKVEREGARQPSLVMLNARGPPVPTPAELRRQRDAQ